MQIGDIDGGRVAALQGLCSLASQQPFKDYVV